MITRRVGVVVALCMFVIVGCKEKKGNEATPAKVETPKAAPVKKPKEVKAAPVAKVSGEAGRLIVGQFSMPVPVGYKRAPQKAIDMMSKQSKQKIEVALFKARAQPDYFMTSVVVTRLATPMENPADLKVCDQAAALSSKAAGVKAGAAKIIKLPIGSTCQFEIGGGKQSAVQTVVYVGKVQWTVTCNFDPRDTPSPSECSQILNGFSAAK